MTDSNVNPSTAGAAFRVSILGQEQTESYRDVHVAIDPENHVVHVFSADARTHYLTVPIASTLIEWRDPSPLGPQLRLPPFGAGAFEQIGEQMQEMLKGMRHGLGEEP